MKTKNLLLIILLHAAPIICMSQYGDAYHKPNNYLIQKEQREYGEQQRAMARINTNTKTTTTTVTNINLDASFVASVEALFNLNKSAIEKEKQTPEEIERKKQWDARKKIDEEATQKRWSDDAARWRAMMKIQQPYIDQFFNAGFRDDESKDIVKNHVLNSANEKRVNTEDVYEIIPLLKIITKNINTISYEELTEAIAGLYYYAPLTCLGLIKKTEKGFKEYTIDLDNLKVNCLVQFSRSEYYNVQYQNEVDLYFELLEKYPDLGKEFLKQTGKKSPYLARMWKLNYNGQYADMPKKDKKKYNELKAEYERLNTEVENERLQSLRTSQSAFYISQTIHKIETDPNVDRKIDLFDVATNTAKFEFGKNDAFKNYGFTKDLIDNKNIEITYNANLLYQLAELNNEKALFLYSILICRNENNIEKEQMRAKLLELIQKNNVFLFVLEYYLSTALYDLSVNTNKETNMKKIVSLVENMKKIGDKVRSYNMFGIGNFMSNENKTSSLDSDIASYLGFQGKQLMFKYGDLAYQAEINKSQTLRTSQSASFILQSIQNNTKTFNRITLFDLATVPNAFGHIKFDFETYCKTNKYAITKELISDKNVDIIYTPELLYQLAELGEEKALFLYSILICKNSSAKVRDQLRDKLLELVQKKDMQLLVLDHYLSTAFYEISVSNNKEANMKLIVRLVENMKKIGDKVPKANMTEIGDYMSDKNIARYLVSEVAGYINVQGYQLVNKYKSVAGEVESEKLNALRTSQSAISICQTINSIDTDPKITKKITVYDVATVPNAHGRAAFNFKNYHYAHTIFSITKELIADKNLEITYSPELLYQLAELNDEKALLLYSILICRNNNAVVREQMRSKLLELSQKKDMFLRVLNFYMSTAFYEISINTKKDENMKHIVTLVENMKKIGDKVPIYIMLGVGTYMTNKYNTQYLDLEIVAYLKNEGELLTIKFKY